MVRFYKHDINDWRGGTRRLSDRAYRVYHVLVEEIMQAEGPVPNDERFLAALSNRSTRDYRAALAELVSAGKIVALPDGRLSNPRTERELDGIKSARERMAEGGRKSRPSGSSTLENVVKHPRNFRETLTNADRKVDENREKISKINGSEKGGFQNASEAPSRESIELRIYSEGIPVPSEQESPLDAKASDDEVRLTTEDPRDVLFGAGAKWLSKRAAITEAKAKTHIGKWIKTAFSDAHAVLAIMRQAQDRKVVDPVAWITASVAARFHPKTPVAQDAKPPPLGLSKRPARP